MKTVSISSFKAHISEELKKVRKGARLIIRDRDTPIAEVVPYSREQTAAINVQQPRLTPFELPPSPIKIDHDPLEYLIDDRGAR